MLVSKLLIRFAPHILGAALLFGGLSVYALKGWWNEYQAKKSVERQLDLAEKIVAEGDASASRYSEQVQRLSTETDGLKAELAEVAATDCFDSRAPDAAIGLFDKARDSAAEAAHDSAD